MDHLSRPQLDLKEVDVPRAVSLINGILWRRTFLPMDLNRTMDEAQGSFGIVLLRHMPVAANACSEIQRLTDVKQFVF